MGATLVGANCGTTLENMEKIITEYAEIAPDFPLWAKPNAGLPHMDMETETAVLRPDAGRDGRVCQEICRAGCARGGRLLWLHPRARGRDCEGGEGLV